MVDPAETITLGELARLLGDERERSRKHGGNVWLITQTVTGSILDKARELVRRRGDGGRDDER